IDEFVTGPMSAEAVQAAPMAFKKAKFWMKVFYDLKLRGVNDFLIAVTDGLKGLAEALGAVYPANTLQTRIPSDDAASKLIWLALRNITADWGRTAHDWKTAMNQFAILCAGRFTAAAA